MLAEAEFGPHHAKRVGHVLSSEVATSFSSLHFALK